MQNNLLMLLPILVPLFSAVLVLATIKKSQIFAKSISVLTVISSLAVIVYLFSGFFSGQEIGFVFESSFLLVLKLDGFRALHLMLSCILWLVAIVFYFEYSKKTKDRHMGAFLSLMLVTFSAVIGIFMSDNLFTLFIFFEVMSFSSYGWVLIGKRKEAKDAANKYLAVSLIGGMIILMGLVVLRDLTTDLSFTNLYEFSTEVGIFSQGFLAGILIVIGFGTKAGMFPFHFWLPSTYVSAPAPATALLSSILSKTGVFGVILVGTNLFMGSYEWHVPMLILGVITMFWGGVCALINADMKRIVAFSSMSQIGFILVGVAMVGLLSEHNAIAASGVVLHMINHSLIKMVLFTICGIFFMQIGSTVLNDIKGYGRKNPFIAAVFTISACGLGGVPFFNGYVSKTLLHESIVEKMHLLEQGTYYDILQVSEWIFLFSGGLTVAYLLKIASSLFQKNDNAKKLKISLATKSVLLIPIIFMLMIGLIPNITADNIALIGTDIMHAHAPEHAVDYFAWINLRGALISLLIGVLVFFLIVRPIMYKKDIKIYKEFYSEKFSIGRLFYIPVFTKILPTTLGAICAVLSGFVDNTAAFVVKYLLKPNKQRDLSVRRHTLSYTFGRLLDKAHLHASKRMEKTGETYAQALEELSKESAKRRKMIQASLSYGLLFAGVGFILIMLYLLFL